MSRNASQFLDPLRQQIHRAWSQLGARERLAVAAAAAVACLALLWWVGLAPALKTLRQAPQQHQQLDGQLARMRALADSAQALRSQGLAQPLARDAAQRALDQATRDLLGNQAQQQLQGDQVTIVLNAASPEALARWLEQVRVNARLVPTQADLQYSATPAGWSGRLVLGGPGLGGGN